MVKYFVYYHGKIYFSTTSFKEVYDEIMELPVPRINFDTVINDMIKYHEWHMTDIHDNRVLDIFVSG